MKKYTGKPRTREEIKHMKYEARNLFASAKARGLISAPKACSICGSDNEQIEGHHFDYARPLDVVWICSSCHRDFHRPFPKEVLWIKYAVEAKIQELYFSGTSNEEKFNALYQKALDEITYNHDGPVTRFVAVARSIDLIRTRPFEFPRVYGFGCPVANALDDLMDNYEFAAEPYAESA